ASTGAAGAVAAGAVAAASAARRFPGVGVGRGTGAAHRAFSSLSSARAIVLIALGRAAAPPTLIVGRRASAIRTPRVATALVAHGVAPAGSPIVVAHRAARRALVAAGARTIIIARAAGAAVARRRLALSSGPILPSGTTHVCLPPTLRVAHGYTSLP